MWKKRILSLVVTTLFVLSAVSFSIIDEIEGANRATLYVGGTGAGNYSTIQSAIDTASDYDTVFVYNGTYYENLVINKTINLIGEDKNTTVIDGGANGDVVYVSADGIEIRRFTIQNSGGSWSDASIQINSNNCTISENIISNNLNGIWLYHAEGTIISLNIITGNNYNGVYLANSHHNFITGNIFSTNLNGIRLNGGNNNTIACNTITSNDFNGIYLFDTCHNTIFDNCFINDGINVFNSSYNYVNNNTVNGKPLVYLEQESDIIINNAGQVILINCTNITIENQYLSHTTIGIELWKTNNCLIHESCITNNQYGLYLSFSSNNTISGNTIVKNNYGIYLPNWCYNNIFSGNKIFLNDNYGLRFVLSSNNTFYNNYFNNDLNAHGSGFNMWNVTKTMGPNIIRGEYLGGNFWTDYNGVDLDGDDLGDTNLPYHEYWNISYGGDWHPLIPILTQTLSLSDGWNLITIPSNHTWTAETLGQNITGCTVVTRLDCNTQTFTTHVVGAPWDDFPIENGIGYYVYTIGNTNFTVTGELMYSVVNTLYPGWNMLGWFHPFNTTAEKLGRLIENCSVVIIFETKNQTFYTHVVGTPHDNFIIERGMGLFIYTTEASIWHGEG